MEMIELLPTHVDPLTKFQPVAIESLSVAGRDASFVLGQFSSGDNFVWVTKGACIEVLNQCSGLRIGSWSFGALTKESSTTIACVIECADSWEPLLLIGLHSRGVGMLCIFNPVKSKLVSAIELPSKVVSLEVIQDCETNILIPYLQKFSDIAVVGMVSGLIYLLDLNLNRQNISDETQPSKVNAVPASTPQIDALHDSLDLNEHLAIIMDNDSVMRGSYQYRKPDGKTMQSFNAADVCVTSLKYIPQITSLLVGMNFGCFQVWKMDGLMLEYSSAYEADLAPITHFIYQEPENDPKEVIYVWIGRGPTFVDRRDGDCSALSLYQFSYDHKKTLHHRTNLYAGLQSVLHKFEYPLTTEPYNMSNMELAGSSLIACEVVSNAAYQRVSRREEGLDDHIEDFSLCSFLWEAASDLDSKPVYLLGLFDLNRWYHAQMPSTVRPSYLSHGVCPFFAFCNLEDIIEIAGPENILAAQIAKESVTRYRSTVTPAVEQHFYPSALAFDLHCLLENSVVSIHFSGVQKQILADMRKNNPEALLEPTDTFNRCSLAEMLPKFSESASDLPLNEQREALLSVCIENSMTDVILTCINSWADGEYSRSGCTLRLILNAAWTRVVKAKKAIDKSCVPLFDCSMTGVDKQTVSLLHQQESELGRLCRVFQQLLNLAGTTTEQGAHDLQVKLNITCLLHEYMQVLTWLLVVGLFPETVEGDDTTGKYNYPGESLSQAFNQRRQELISLHQDLAFTDLLMIDGLIDNIGATVKDLWNKEGGSGLYPPPSLHAAVAIYLLEDVAVTAKHCVLFYLLLDLISFASDQDHKLVQECSLFAQCFGVTPSLARLVQGFWLLDHRDFAEALHVLLDPIISEQDLAEWQHTRIVKALLYQGDARAALVYVNTRLANPTSAEDVKLRLTVLLASGNINQAFEYQRQRRDAANCHDLTEHFFSGCLQTKNLGRLVQLPLDDFEDKQLAEFLREANNRESLELLVMYYLQRGRYVQAIRLNEQIQKLGVVDTNPEVVQRAAARDAIIQAHIKNLPEVQRDLVRSGQPDVLPTRRERIEVAKPKPLSTKVNNNPQNRITSRATLICAVMEKVKEVEHLEVVSQDEEPVDVFIGLPSTPKPTRVLSERSVDVRTADKELLLSPSLKRTPLTTRGSPLSKISDSAKRRLQRYQNSEAMSVLATPPVKRAAVSRARKPMATPQSILKVRNTVRNMSPLVKIRAAPKNEEQQPTIGRRNPFVSVSGSPHALKPGTPKLLRFVLSPTRTAALAQTDSADAASPDSLKSNEEPVLEDASTSRQVVEVDEDITFTFNVSHLKRDDTNKMDTDASSCPSTPSAVDERGTPEPSPTKPLDAALQSAQTPKELRFADVQTPREQISQSIEDMDSDLAEKDSSRLSRGVATPRSDKPASPYEPSERSASPYEPAKKMLEEFRAEYASKPLIEPTLPRKSIDNLQVKEIEIEDSEMTTDIRAPKISSGASLHALGSDLSRIIKDDEPEASLGSRAEKSLDSLDMDVDIREKRVEVKTDYQREPPKEIVRLAKDASTPKSQPVVTEQLRPIEKEAPKETTPPKGKSLTPPDISPETEVRDSPPPDIESYDVVEISSQSDSDEPPVLEPMVTAKAAASLKKSRSKLAEPPNTSATPRREPPVNTSAAPSSPRRREPPSPDASATPPSPRRSPRIAKKLSPAKNAREESPDKRQSNPLSSDAFMMKVRSATRGARDHTPEASVPDAPIRFVFSDPVSVQADDMSGPRTPAQQPFIFSPPVTRSRGRRRDDVRSSRSRPLSSEDVSGLFDTSISDSASHTFNQTADISLTKSGKKTRRKISVDAVFDSPINFVSPVASAKGGDLDDTKSGHAAKMKLRSRFKVIRPERKSMRLMKK